MTDCVQVAKEIRAALKTAFPNNVKFSVKSSRYSMGSSVTVSWENMPSRGAVEAIIDQFSRVRRCEYTGEILSGGNMYVSASIDYTPEFRAEVEGKMDESDINNLYRYQRAFDEIVDAMWAEQNTPVKKVVEEVVTTNEETATGETVEASDAVTMAINEDLNGIELKFSKTLTEEELKTLYANGFKWSRRGGKWYAKQTPERLEFAQALVIPSNAANSDSVTETQETQETASETVIGSQNDNVIYYEFSQNEAVETKQEGDTVDNTYINIDTENDNDINSFGSFDNIFSKFEDIEITTEQKISSEDLNFCQEQEKIYNQLVAVYNGFNAQLLEIAAIDKEHGKKYGNQSGNYFHTQNTAYYYSYSADDIKKTVEKMKEKFIDTVCYYFEKKYSITIDHKAILKKYRVDVNYKDIVNDINEQLGGYNFIEKAEQEIKAKVRENLYHSEKKLVFRNNKLIIDGYFVRFDSIWKEYRLTDRKECILRALSHFDNGSVKINQELSDKYCGYENEKKDSNYEKYETQSLNKVKSIRFLKNGKMEIEFTSNQIATKFASEYCGYNQQSA